MKGNTDDYYTAIELLNEFIGLEKFKKLKKKRKSFNNLMDFLLQKKLTYREALKLISYYENSRNRTIENELTPILLKLYLHNSIVQKYAYYSDPEVFEHYTYFGETGFFYAPYIPLS